MIWYELYPSNICNMIAFPSMLCKTMQKLRFVAAKRTEPIDGNTINIDLGRSIWRIMFYWFNKFIWLPISLAGIQPAIKTMSLQIQVQSHLSFCCCLSRDVIRLKIPSLMMIWYDMITDKRVICMETVRNKPLISTLPKHVLQLHLM